MPADPNIYNAFAQPARSATDYANAFLGQQAQRQAIGANALKLQSEQQNLDQQQATNNERNAIRSYVAGKDLTDPSVQQGIYQVAPLTGGAFIKNLADTQKTQAETTHLGAQTSDALANAERTKTQHAIEVQAQIAQAAGAAVDQASWDRGLQIAKTLGADVSQIPTQFDPATAKAIHDQALTGVQQLDAHYKQMTADETARHNKADEANTVRGQNVTASNNRATIQKDLLVAGIGPDGAPTTDVAATVKAIGEGRMAPPTLQALRNPRMASIMNQVNQQYPNFDATVYGERQKAMKDFGTGPQGQQVQAANTALNHLDTLEQLAKAQANGNIPLFNQLANRFAAETGSQVPTNLQGAITLVGPEISKAVVGAGGGQGDREKVDAALSAITKGSPDQQAGQIATMKDIFGGRLSEVGRTYQRATHLENFGDMLSPAAQAIYAAKHGPGAKTPAAASGAVPDDIAAILAKHGTK